MYDRLILVSLDTLRSDCIATNPLNLWRKKYTTRVDVEPSALDELARGGTFFPNCITSAPYTSAAHGSYFTGKWPLRHGAYEQFNHSLKGETIFSTFKKHGYGTIFKTDFPITLGPYLGFHRGIDQYIIEDDDEALRSLGSEKQYLAFVHFGGLHIPYGFHNLRYGGRDYLDKIRELEKEVPDQDEPLADRLVETYRDEEDLELMLRYKRVVQFLYRSAAYDRLFSLYLEGANHFFSSRFTPFLERLLARLEGTSFLLVVFGDHGEEYDADSYGHHNTLAEGVLRVPVIFYGPRVPAATHLDRVRTVDIAPTLLEMVGVAGRSAPSADGVSLAATVLGGDAYPVRPAFAQTYSSEMRENVAFQRRMLERRRKIGGLRHVLYKEAVYSGNARLIRQHHRYTRDGGIWGLEPCAPAVTLERLDERHEPRPFHDPAVEAECLEMLDAYNRLRRPRGGRATVTEEIRRQLQVMGYHV